MSMTTGLYGGKFEPHNQNNPRTLIANWVAPGSAVLEVGPGDGVISRYLTQTRGCHAVGVEVMAQAAPAAQGVYNPLIIGSIESATVLDQLRPLGPFDAIVFADVLEHLWTRGRCCVTCAVCSRPPAASCSRSPTSRTGAPASGCSSALLTTPMAI